ncbi:MAG TPA: biotin--[acetyl-CoA-carboxylase] ligase [Christensenellaceae bacterium]|jgi:BirA family biotin operon repressor/biotin-[acetyl-CoA-carboxylase] ligase|nr:biotin--[acetyl-CoA-carboxylase] ligase [Christensenellaceae bacterium]
MDIELLKKLYSYPVYGYSIVDSTNKIALDMAKSGVVHGSLIVADSQTSGRGRHGRSFFSPKGGIYMSIVLDMNPQFAGEITTLCAVAVCLAASKLLNIELKIKWVNDCLYENKKVCGILCEGLPQMGKCVAGIGVNINREEFPSDINEKAGSIYIGDNEREELCAYIANYVINGTKNIPNHMAEYKKRLITLNKKVFFTYKGENTHGIAIDVDNTGALIVETETRRIRLISGEVSVRV